MSSRYLSRKRSLNVAGNSLLPGSYLSYRAWPPCLAFGFLILRYYSQKVGARVPQRMGFLCLSSEIIACSSACDWWKAGLSWGNMVCQMQATAQLVAPLLEEEKAGSFPTDYKWLVCGSHNLKEYNLIRKGPISSTGLLWPQIKLICTCGYVRLTVRRKMLWEEVSGGKEDELALSYMQEQSSSGHLSSHSHLCGSEKLWQRSVLNLCFEISLGTSEISCASVFRSWVCLSVSD